MAKQNQPSEPPQISYLKAMKIIRGRFDEIDVIRDTKSDQFLTAETCAFHGRKIVEGIAFACLIALQNGIGHIPRDVKGQWKADAIINSLEKKKLGSAYPSPSILRDASTEEKSIDNVKYTIDGQPEWRITKDEIKRIYVRMHRWNHEVNPYIEEDRIVFLAQYEGALKKDIEALKLFIFKHFISIGGSGFFCTLQDDVDGAVKVLPLTTTGETSLIVSQPAIG